MRMMDSGRSNRLRTAPRGQIDEMTAFRGSGTERLAWWSLLVFLALCALGGGSNRSEVVSLLFLRPAAVVAIAGFLLIRIPTTMPSKAPLILLGIYAADVASQLIPMPPSLWTVLPGRATFIEAAVAAGIPQPWRPISLAPDRTWDSLLATTTGFAILLGMRRLRSDQLRGLVAVMLAIILGSGLLGVLQTTGTLGGEGHLYQLTNSGEPVGLFANRNHQAALLACGLPLLRVWLVLHTRPGPSMRGITAAVVVIALLVGVVIVVTGSRAGIMLGLVGALGGILIAPIDGLSPQAGRSRVLILVTIGFSILLLTIMVASGRATSYNRMVSQNYVELRVLNLPMMIHMLWTFFPVGTGYGSFDRIFQMFESDRLLRPDYFNRAHDDYLEVAITGGVIGVTILAAAMVWAARASWRAFRAPPTRTIVMARGAGVMLAILTLASAVDYPLRTPLIGAITAIAFGFLGSLVATSDKGQAGAVPVA